MPNFEDDDDIPAIDICRNCQTPASCALYERCAMTDDELGQESEL